MLRPNQKINWPGALFLILSPIAAVGLGAYHLFQSGFLWPIWIVAFIFYVLTVVSITGGYHRYFSHRTYQAKPWVKWFWALFGAAAFQNSILIWARDHRVHHRFVDTDLDPYSISRGFWWAHFGWMLVNEEPKLDIEPYGRDLEKDPIVMFQHRYYALIATAMGLGLPTLIGYFLGSALGGLAIAGFLRIVIVHHMTFFINSWCHVFGRQDYTDKNTARDSFAMAIATFGEGYHNFHHIFANDYRNGIRWYHWDPTKWTIQLLKLVGGVYALRRTPQSLIIRAQMEMQEKQLRAQLRGRWTAQFEGQIQALRLRVDQALVHFEKSREEYKALAAGYAKSSMDPLSELKTQSSLAKIELHSSLKQWRLLVRRQQSLAH